MKRANFIVIILALLTNPQMVGLAEVQIMEVKNKSSILVDKPRDFSVQGIGALGRIEPLSRVIRVSHNAGAEGVMLQELFVREGNRVNKGTILALLADNAKRKAEIEAVNAEIQALQAKLSAEKLTLTFTKTEYDRYDQLATTATASQSTVDQKKWAFKQSQSTIHQLEAEIASSLAKKHVAEAILANTVIRAPIAGTIMKIHNWPGEQINDFGLLEMADLTALDVVAEIYESDLPKVQAGQLAEIRLIGLANTFSAIVREIGFMVKKNDLNDTDPLADKDNRIIEVRLTLDQEAVAALQHQIFRQVQVRILP